MHPFFKGIFLIVLALIFISGNEVYALDSTLQNTESIEAKSDTATTGTVIQDESHTSVMPHPLSIIPFVLLLLMIATGPIFYHRFWEHNYPKIAIIFGLIIVVYYAFFLREYSQLFHTVEEYISFIALLSSLYVASGGILIKVDKKATPLVNTVFLFIGAVISNFIGTTGASMLFIRPFIRMNKGRIRPYHIIFFIFIVSNIGGGLTPVGDPPLFLGFLKGVPFFWVVEHVWFIWLSCILIILAVFYFFDSHNHVPGEDDGAEHSGKITIKGGKNFIYLGVILCSVFLDPAIISWVPNLPTPFGIREIIMFSVVYLSYRNANKEALKANEFDFEPIKEVAYLFVGIFLTMIPALQIIAYQAKEYKEFFTSSVFYWATGILSSFLDNAPTYLNFLSAAMGKYGMTFEKGTGETMRFIEIHQGAEYLTAISIAAVFFGAMTYIGNGPNFMVKSIAERAGIKMPSFIEYLYKYSIPFLIPIFIVIWLLFFNH